jgi:hypothetical protein
MNSHLAYFHKDIFEVIPLGWLLTMVQVHLKQFRLQEFQDREMFHTFIEIFFTPKIFLFLIAPLPKQASPFAILVIPLLRASIPTPKFIDRVFKLLWRLLMQYNTQEHPIVARYLVPLLREIGRFGPAFKQWTDRTLLIYPLTIAHYIFYYLEPSDFDDQIATTALYCRLLSRCLSDDEKQLLMVNAPTKAEDHMERISKALIQGAGAVHQATPQQRRFATALVSEVPPIQANSPAAVVSDKADTFDALSFSMQVALYQFVESLHTVPVFNGIVCHLFDVGIPALLIPYVRKGPNVFAEALQGDLFVESSQLGHLLKVLFRRLDPEYLALVERLIEIEKQYCGSANRCVALCTRAISKTTLTPDLVAMSKGSTFGDLIGQLFSINQRLKLPEFQTEPDIYSELLFQRAELLSRSPDARAVALRELLEYYKRQKFNSEMLISLLTIAALVAEYLMRLGRIPRYFEGESAAKCFSIASPSAVSEECPPEVARDLPRLHGFCTGGYFSEWGLVNLLNSAADDCKRAELYELSSKIMLLLSPIAESRRLWAALQHRFRTGSFSWNVIAQMSTSTDRSLGNYFRVQFLDANLGLRNFIYRETGLMNLWALNAKMKKSAELFAMGKPIEVVNEGDELVPGNCSPHIYYVHVKAVAQYFTSAERKKRVTVFEQHQNVFQFYFDVPFSESAQSSIEYCWLRRTIFTLPHPMPYILKRVEVPNEMIEKTNYSPIEYSCQNMQSQIDKMQEAMARKDMKALQPLIQGSLVTQVNEGPKKIAEVFLGRGSQHDPNGVAELRQLFREFLETSQKALELHETYAQENPVYRLLQERLVDGLNRLRSAVQPYLK